MTADATGPLVVDTHAVVWFLQRHDRLSQVARERMRGALAGGYAIHVASISLVELVYLVEKARIPARVAERVDEVLRDSDSGFLLAPLDLRVAEATRLITRAEVPDLPDRVIAATALALRCPLVTRDGKIRRTGIETIW